MASGRRAVPIGGMVPGVALMAFAIQTADEVFVVWEVMDLGVNLTGSAPQ